MDTNLIDTFKEVIKVVKEEFPQSASEQRELLCNIFSIRLDNSPFPPTVPEQKGIQELQEDIVGCTADDSRECKELIKYWQEMLK